MGDRSKAFKFRHSEGCLSTDKHSRESAEVVGCHNIHGACGACHCIQIKKESYRDCTAFISPFGTFHYIRMSFSLSNAGSMYSRMLDLAMTHLPADYRLSYLDYILVYSTDLWVHLDHLR